jgi:hypothetical protein
MTYHPTWPFEIAIDGSLLFPLFVLASSEMRSGEQLVVHIA